MASIQPFSLHKTRYTLVPLLEELLSIYCSLSTFVYPCMSAISQKYFKVLHLVEES